jgi:hypothetical protein
MLKFSLPIVLPGQANKQTEKELTERRKREQTRLQHVS